MHRRYRTIFKFHIFILIALHGKKDAVERKLNEILFIRLFFEHKQKVHIHNKKRLKIINIKFDNYILRKYSS